ncbi:DNA internalization-related competence protein ComEC/Rec2 [Acinetobacter beijerinckii]|uniref:DNA internalization-related competence protein ComEC/Rec2 n=1 Tax=Acinetobacter beijerinckii TaxID=262668 RepID=UPI0023DDF905|nr:DNA internalization-related competence protein ComEC/Rec2 [Acinetobacter beijerinckii]MDF2417453.1 DNA internalization-related competence protein ComEC/Rec2 [Acinetobacter beijerinckii]
MLKIILLGWIAGIAMMGHHFSFVSTSWWIWLSIAMIIFGMGCIKRNLYFDQPIYKSLILISASWALFCTGYHFADSRLEQRLELRELETQPFEAIVYIKKIDEPTLEGHKQVAEILNRHAQPVNWMLYLKNNPHVSINTQTLQLGHYYRIYGKIKPAHSYAIAGAFDQEKWFLQQNIMSAFSVQNIQALTLDEVYGLGYQPHLKQQQAIPAKFLLEIEKIRLTFRQMLERSSLNNKGLLLALLTGDESLLSSTQKDQFQQLGISHLLAISGPHVLIFAFMFTWLLKITVQRFHPKLYLWKPRQILLLLPFVFSVLLYVAFVGFEIPAIRTLLTVIIASLFLIIRQSFQPFALLVYSASLLLIYDPFSILSAAFWLSYGACFILLRIYQTIEQLPKDQISTVSQRFFFSIKILVESQWKIFVALMPLVLIFFQQISWVAPFSNLIAIPLLSGLIVPVNIFAACVWLISAPLGQFFFQISDSLLSLLMVMLNVLQAISPDLYGVSCTPLMMLCLIIGILIIFMPRGTIPKAWAIICFLPILFGLKAQPTVLSILDVGQGQAVLLQHPEQVWMIDTGGSYDESKFSLGERVVIPFLRQQGVRSLDHVVLSHLDQDHSGAFNSIQNKFEIRNVQSNERKDKIKVKDNFSFCQQGQNWSYANLKIEILFPHQQELIYAKDQQNEYSCVVYIQFLNAQPYQNFLIMGDAGWETEYKLLQQYPDLKVDVLVLGHHGSKHSSAYDFLAALKPKIAIASAGDNNRYGHPSEEVKNRLHALNIPLFNTVQTGTISFSFDKGKVEIKQQRHALKWLNRE